jgi:hypothetical protein
MIIEMINKHNYKPDDFFVLMYSLKNKNIYDSLI